MRYKGMEDRNRQIAVELMEHNAVLTELENDNWYLVEDDITNTITEATNEFLEKGLEIGSIVSQLESKGKITFTCDMSYDNEFLELARFLIDEFDKQSKYEYFTEFVWAKLQEMQEKRETIINQRT